MQGSHYGTHTSVSSSSGAGPAHWPEFTYPADWECDNEFMCVHFFPLGRGGDKQRQSQLKVWPRWIESYAKQLAGSKHRVTFTVGDITSTFTRRNGMRPECVADVLTEMASNGTIAGLRDFLSNSWTSTAFSALTSVYRWAVSKKPSLPAPPFVCPAAVDVLARQVYAHLYNHCPSSDRLVMTIAHMRKIIQSKFNLSQEDLKVVHEHLARNKKIAMFNIAGEKQAAEDIVKLTQRWDSVVDVATSADRQFATMQSLKSKEDDIDKKIKAKEVRRVNIKRRILVKTKGLSKPARLQWLRKHPSYGQESVMLGKSMEKLRQAKLNLQKVLMKIQDVKDNAELLDIFRMATTTLRTTQQEMDTEAAAAAMDELSEQCDVVEEMNDITGQEVGPMVDDSELERDLKELDELDALEKLNELETLPVPPSTLPSRTATMQTKPRVQTSTYTSTAPMQSQQRVPMMMSMGGGAAPRPKPQLSALDRLNSLEVDQSNPYERNMLRRLNSLSGPTINTSALTGRKRTRDHTHDFGTSAAKRRKVHNVITAPE